MYAPTAYGFVDCAAKLAPAIPACLAVPKEPNALLPAIPVAGAY